MLRISVLPTRSATNPTNLVSLPNRFPALGIRKAPANCGRMVTYIQFVALKLLYLAVGAFASDVYGAENLSVSSSVFLDPKQLVLLIGFNTSDKMDQVPSSGLTLIGA